NRLQLQHMWGHVEEVLKCASERILEPVRHLGLQRRIRHPTGWTRAQSPKASKSTAETVKARRSVVHFQFGFVWLTFAAVHRLVRDRLKDMAPPVRNTHAGIHRSLNLLTFQAMKQAGEL